MNLMSNLNLDKVDWLIESRLGSQDTSVQASTSSWDDLATSSVDGVSVERDIIQVEADTANVLLGHWTLFSQI